MIYVAVGTQKFQFDRLLKIIDKLIENGLVKDEVFAQIGYSKYQPVNYSYKEFLSKKEFDEYIIKCNLLITHSGVATIMAGLKYNKPIVVMPRLAKYKEHVDDHQVQIAEAFTSKNFVLKCDENDNLYNLITEVKNHKFDQYISQNEFIISTIRDYIKTI